VVEFFGHYIGSGLAEFAHLTGWAHSQGNANKVWDLWVLIGTSMVSTAYLAGHRFGTAWQEQDVLDDIEIASGGPDGTD
jgi:hypothetical protein